ncbi:MAG: hypothetical protein ACFE95_12210 [Candidatus Hodarchaeota archaeon]
MIFSFPFSGTLISFGDTDFTEDKRIYCPSCYWKSVIEISTSWGLRIVHVFGIIFFISFLFFYFEFFFEHMIDIIFSSTLPEETNWLILSIYLFPIVFLVLINVAFIIIPIGVILIILYSLLIDGPRRSKKARNNLQKFLNGSGTVDFSQSEERAKDRELKFSYEIKKSMNQTKIIIVTPIHKSKIPKLIAPIMFICFSIIFITDLIDAILHKFTFNIDIVISLFAVCLISFVSLIFFSQFAIVVENDNVKIGKWFWKFHHGKTISKHAITNIHWDISGKRPEFYLYLSVETSSQMYQFQPLGMTIPISKPRPELQQFLDSFLKELNHLLMK